MTMMIQMYEAGNRIAIARPDAATRSPWTHLLILESSSGTSLDNEHRVAMLMSVRGNPCKYSMLLLATNLCSNHQTAGSLIKWRWETTTRLGIGRCGMRGG
jgi:hypothetical protein